MSSIIKEESGSKKSIDPGDWISAIIEFVRTFFLERGVVLSEKAYVSLFLSIFSVFLIWLSSNKYEAYLLPLGFFIYFLLHLLSNWAWSQNLLMKLSNRSKYDIKCIKENRIAHTKVALIIAKYATKEPQEVIGVIENFIEQGRFKEDLQIALLQKYNEYPNVLVKYIDDILLKYDFSPKALRTFLSTGNLNEDYLKKLVIKYRKYKPFIFNLGRFQFYKFEKGSLDNKYYTAGYYFKKSFNIISNIFAIIIILLLVIIFILVIGFNTKYFTIFAGTYRVEIYAFSVSLIFMAVLLVVHIGKRVTEKKIRSSLEKEGIKLEDIDFEKFIREVKP